MSSYLIVKHDVRIELVSYPRHEQLKKEVYDSLLNYEDKQNRESNVKAVMTEWNLTSPEIERLKNYIINSLKSLPETQGELEQHHLLRWGPPGNFKFKNFWGNVYRYGDYTCSHGHIPEDLTMVYFLTAEEGDAPLLLDDSKTPIYPQEGLFALFPSYVFHSVPKHMSNNVRITLSGDINRRTRHYDDLKDQHFKDQLESVKLDDTLIK